MNYSERLETVLRDLAQKFGVRDSRGTLLIPKFGHADFAEMIGSSRPMVSRLIAEMIANRRLAYDGGSTSYCGSEFGAALGFRAAARNGVALIGKVQKAKE